jgi:hypothetical protein
VPGASPDSCKEMLRAFSLAISCPKCKTASLRGPEYTDCLAIILDQLGKERDVIPWYTNKVQQLKSHILADMAEFKWRPTWEQRHSWGFSLPLTEEELVKEKKEEEEQREFMEVVCLRNKQYLGCSDDDSDDSVIPGDDDPHDTNFLLLSDLFCYV